MSVLLVDAFFDDVEANISGIGQISPVVGDPNGNFPSLTYTLRDGYAPVFYRGSFGLNTLNIDLNLFSPNYTELQTIKYALLTRYNGFSGSLGTQIVSRIQVVNAFDTFDDDSNTRLYHVIVELEFTY